MPRIVKRGLPGRERQERLPGKAMATKKTLLTAFLQNHA
jgi:hypothetical protein